MIGKKYLSGLEWRCEKTWGGIGVDLVGGW
jgi:hypothetical protein